MNIQQIEEALTVFDTETRCQRVLDEVQPVLRKLMDDVKSRYAIEAPEIMDYYVHTYESTLRTTITDMRNPKYASQKVDTNIGKKAFVDWINKQYFQTEYYALSLEVYGPERQLRIVLTSDFYPFWEGVRTKANAANLEKALNELPDDVNILTSDKLKPSILKDELIPFIKQCASEKRRPWFYFGTVIGFDDLPSDDEMVGLIWSTWNKLQAIRQFVREEAYSHSLSMRILDELNSHQESLKVNLFGHSYEVKFEETSPLKSKQRRQKYGLYDKGQLVMDGMLQSLLREPNEAIGVHVNGYGHLFYNLRNLHEEAQAEWFMTKSFKFHKKDGVDLNKIYQDKVVAALKEHGFQMDGNSFYVGTWNNEKLRFVEPIEDVKRKLIMAALISSDCTEMINLPKENEELPDPLLNGDGERGLLEEETFAHNFDLSAILANVRESSYTYSDAIIRDFHLNLTSLEDKHFVILNGISGTGKTKLCLLYANAVYGNTLDTANPYLKVIPVRPDWTDSTSLFGYYSALEKRYVRTPFLNAVLQAVHEGKPMFIVLDEMNLARIEYYLSDYLSAVESRQPIRLHSEESVTDVPQELQIPHNLYVIGTINVDETTHGISDKVLDRAFVMTLSDVDLESFWESAPTKYKAALPDEWEMLKELHGELSQYDLHFGYRTMSEMLRKLYANKELDSEIGMKKLEAIDRVVAEKVLPKIRGDERIAPLLESFIEWTNKQLEDNSESRKHLLRMKGELDRYGACQFWR